MLAANHGGSLANSFLKSLAVRCDLAAHAHNGPMAKAKPPKWRLRIYVSPPLVNKVKIAAERNGRSVSGFCRKLIARAVARAESRA